jgi:predicted CXXCH cytochrome family protein
MIRVLSIAAFLPLALTAAAQPSPVNHFVGRDVCAGCHKDIAATQATTAMAQTWQGRRTKQIPSDYSASHAEGPDPAIEYRIIRSPTAFSFQVKMPGDTPMAFPVETTMGGRRHGLSFLVRATSLDGASLDRPPLIEARYLHYAPHGKLELSPGFPAEKPSNYETSIGRVLGPSFGKKCLTCHGEPRTIGTHVETGVTCESCHGAGRDHLSAVAAESVDLSIVNPKKLPISSQMQPCSSCHAGFSLVEDPMPDDLLISDQVTALSNSECWRQSGGEITCVNCHNPHQDAPRPFLVKRSETTCLNCHSSHVEKHAALCPVNQQSNCVSCHMPDGSKPPMRIADHWIRVFGNSAAPAAHKKEWASEVVPRHLYLRMIVVSSKEKADDLRRQLLSGTSFFTLARANSTDRSSAENGGFLGDVKAEDLPPPWSGAALKLKPGEISSVVEVGENHFILQRLSRNFREDAETIFNKAMELRTAGNQREAAAGFLEALKVYPHLLRALTYLGITYGEAGNPQTGSAILQIATRLYPEDAGAHFNLGIAYGAMGKTEEIQEYRRAIEINPDLPLAYLNLGAALYAKGEMQEAIRTYRQGIDVNPLIASLHYSLGIALDQRGEHSEAARQIEFAKKIDPAIANSMQRSGGK